MGFTEPFKPVIVVPTYNNAATVGGVIESLFAFGLPLIVVNDGATDETAGILAKFANDRRVNVVVHPINRGKAAALRTGFNEAAERGFTHAITMDSDGQLDCGDVPRMLEAARSSPSALVIGVRDDSAADYPSRSKRGRTASNFFVKLESGLVVSDSQCGLRVYPLALTTKLRCWAERFGFETEIITRTGWAGGSIVEVPVSCKYEEPGKHKSHFRPWIDSWRAVGMHARLVGRAFLPWPHQKLIEQPKPPRESGAIWRNLARWLNPARMWRELREQQTAPRELATGLAVGVFIANLPLYGLQTLIGLYTARKLHLNPLAVVAGTHVSTLPFGPLLIALAVGVGNVVIHGTWLSMAAWPTDFHQWIHLLGSFMVQWAVGSLIVGAALGTAVFFVSEALLRMVAVERE